VARGIRASGSQFLIYDVGTGDLAIVPNPEGVAAVGQPPARTQQPGQPGPGPGPGTPAQPLQPVPVLMHIGTKSNTVAAVGYGADGKQAGIVAVRIP
jgi:hypothetical protein